MLTVLLVYELARRMFGAATGLLAGIVLASAIEFCMLAHAATPDSTLLLFTILTFYLFWIGSRNGSRAWFIPCGMAAGLAMLTKGPVGIVMPCAVIFLYLFWNGELKRLLDRRVLHGLLAFFVVAGPWYILVSVETRGVWIKQFIGKENLTRFAQPMEEHSGPIFYHLVGIIILFAPWSIVLGATIHNALREMRTQPEETPPQRDERQACRLLICWMLTYLVFFSLAATKLPNYVLPVYPALAILTARFLNRWRTNSARFPRWVMPVALAVLAAIGIVTGVGLAIGGGLIPLAGVKMVTFPGLERWLWLGAIPILGAAVAGFYLLRQRRDLLIASLAITSVSFVALIAAFPANSFDRYKAPRELVMQSGVRQSHRDIRLLALEWFQPSVVFYSQREVERINTWPEAGRVLAMEAPVYLFVPEPVWIRVQDKHANALAYRTIARQFDFLRNCDVLVVTNQ